MKTLAIAAALLIFRPAFAQVIYNINFETQDQGLDQVVRTGPPPQ